MIDGQFDQRLAVGPSEILGILSRGVRVYGGASLGALRAAELHDQGMVGVGTVFEWYRSGHVSAEDEVAVAYDPEGFRCLSMALVNLRYLVEQLSTVGVLTPHEAEEMMASGRRLHYTERTLGAILATSGCSRPGREAAERLWNSGTADIKRLDALATLRRVCADAT